MSKTPKPEPLAPSGVRELADVALDDADNFYRHWFEAQRHTLALLEKHLADARHGADAVANKAITFAAHNVTSAFEFAHRLMQAGSAHEMVRLQIEFCERQAHAFAAQLQDLGRTAVKAAEPPSS